MKSKSKLHLDEHFILSNLKSRLPHYALMWLLAIGFAYIMNLLPIEQPVYDYAGARAFSVAFLTISVTTVTFAIPTCMRTIFAAYDQYYSTKIKEILLVRFPVTLLAVSAFTSLILSLLIISGILGIAIPVSPAYVFYVALFWTLVCISYLFIAIEKLIYFVVKAPYAVLDKLEYGVSSLGSIQSREDYDEFRRELASMNDIAATIISKSTGQDEAITKVLEIFRGIHSHYLQQVEDDQSEKMSMNACRAVDHEIVRIFRVSAAAKNEQAARNILKTYCSMLADAMAAGCGIWYFSDMLSQLERIQSYADASSVGEIKSLAYAYWFFMLASCSSDDNHDPRKYTGIARELSSALRRATVNNSEETIAKFLRVASNSELDYDIPSLQSRWITMLDRAVFVYLTWLIDSEPDHVETYLDYVKKYSSVTTGVFRSVLPNTPDRVKALLTYESVVSQSKENVDAVESVAKSSSSDKTVLTMSMHQEDNAAHTIAFLLMLTCSGMDLEELVELGDVGRKIKKEIEELPERFGDEDVVGRMELAEQIVPNILDKIGSENES